MIHFSALSFLFIFLSLLLPLSFMSLLCLQFPLLPKCLFTKGLLVMAVLKICIGVRRRATVNTATTTIGAATIGATTIIDATTIGATTIGAMLWFAAEVLYFAIAFLFCFCTIIIYTIYNVTFNIIHHFI